MKFQLLTHRRQAHGAAISTLAPWHGGDADLHAGGHLRHGQSHDAGDGLSEAMDARRSCLGNTFHLWLRPGLDVIEKHQGLHRFMGWKQAPSSPIQAASRYSAWGRCARSPKRASTLPAPINGDQADAHTRNLDAASSARWIRTSCHDLRRVHALPGRRARRRATRCASASDGPERSRSEWPGASGDAVRPHGEHANALFGIVQGGMHERPARRVTGRTRPTIGFEGYAIGGLSVGEPKEDMAPHPRPHRAATAGRTSRAT
jgi:queuine tRNA-ribosyltransferase